jgi:sterol 3beta-glucosyltransferase
MSIYQDREYLIVHKVLVDSWGQCKDADVLLESPSAMAGVHIAEALRE